jgi:hypothetical protein
MSTKKSIPKYLIPAFDKTILAQAASAVAGLARQLAVHASLAQELARIEKKNNLSATEKKKHRQFYRDTLADELMSKSKLVKAFKDWEKLNRRGRV